jgi:DNA polymerase-3 subunit epsilon
MAAATLENLRAQGWLETTELQIPLDIADVVIADVESSGLNPHADRLIAIGAVAARGGAVQLAESFEVVLRQSEVSSADNILVHRISTDQQREGLAPEDALLAFLAYARGRLLIGYHAAFDKLLIERACAQYLGVTPRLRWLDLALLAPAVEPHGALDAASRMRGARAQTLDWWLAHFAITNRARHAAAADALATAALWAAVSARAPRALEKKVATTASLRDCVRLADEYQWLLAH